MDNNILFEKVKGRFNLPFEVRLADGCSETVLQKEYAHADFDKKHLQFACTPRKART